MIMKPVYKDYGSFVAYQHSERLIQIDDLHAISGFSEKRRAYKAYADFMKDISNGDWDGWVCKVTKENSILLRLMYKIGAVPYNTVDDGIFFFKGAWKHA